MYRQQRHGSEAVNSARRPTTRPISSFMTERNSSNLYQYESECDQSYQTEYARRGRFFNFASRRTRNGAVNVANDYRTSNAGISNTENGLESTTQIDLSTGYYRPRPCPSPNPPHETAIAPTTTLVIDLMLPEYVNQTPLERLPFAYSILIEDVPALETVVCEPPPPPPTVLPAAVLAQQYHTCGRCINEQYVGPVNFVQQLVNPQVYNPQSPSSNRRMVPPSPTRNDQNRMHNPLEGRTETLQEIYFRERPETPVELPRIRNDFRRAPESVMNSTIYLPSTRQHFRRVHTLPDGLSILHAVALSIRSQARQVEIGYPLRVMKEFIFEYLDWPMTDNIRISKAYVQKLLWSPEPTLPVSRGFYLLIANLFQISLVVWENTSKKKIYPNRAYPKFPLVHVFRESRFNHHYGLMKPHQDPMEIFSDAPICLYKNNKEEKYYGVGHLDTRNPLLATFSQVTNLPINTQVLVGSRHTVVADSDK